MVLDPRTLALVKQRLDEAERSIQYIRQTLTDGGATTTSLATPDELAGATGSGQERVLEGVFDGKNMQGSDGQEYPIPPNYASKSKLVEGDILKLTIGADGSFVYKQIRPVERKRVVGKLIVDDQGKFSVRVEDKLYNILLASVTFYKAEEGDDVTILLPVNGEAEWGAVEHVIHHHE